MSAVEQGPQDIDAALEQFLVPKDQLPALPKLGLAARLYADTRVHRIVPGRVGFGLATARAKYLYRRSPEQRIAANRAMRWLLGKSERAGEVDALTLPHMIETAKRSEFLWRPWMGDTLIVENAEICHELERTGRGGILNFMHHGPYVGLTKAMDNAGVHPYAAIAPFYFEAPTPGYAGHRDRQHMLMLREGAHVFSAAGSFPLLLALLADGRFAGISSDSPGSTEMTFLGRRVKAASGATKISIKTGVPIIPLTMHRRDGGKLVVRVEEPIEPTAYDNDVARLQQAIADAHEPAVLKWPEAFEWPFERWTPADPEDAKEFAPEFPPTEAPA